MNWVEASGSGGHSNICSWKVRLRASSYDDSALLGIVYRPQRARYTGCGEGGRE